MALLMLVVYLPFLHKPFGTFSLTLEDWAIAVCVSISILPVLDLAKWMVRRGWFGR
ncbi:MAG: cation transporting ATPase C-terminal domain-containing protein [Acidobacteria bacterium]|nr:cation transporting ATPase C-terminal domain-containing protein [Acidobacteriota bacterium]